MKRREFVSTVAAGGIALMSGRRARAEASDIQFTATMHDPRIPLYGTQAAVRLSAFDASLPDATVEVAAGQSLIAAAPVSALDVLVLGKLSLSSELRCRTLTVVDGGELEMHEGAVLTIRDMPINTTLDPSQYGHGLLVIDGKLTITTDDWRQAYAQLAQEIHAGDTTIELTGEARGWRAGDRLVLPDTRQPTTGADLSAQTEVVTIVSTHLGTIVTVDPVQFDHLGWRKSDGTVGLLPDVACITQPIVIRSENPNGVRGHVFVTAASHQDVEGVSLVEMGRTTTALLHSTLRDDQGNIAQIGTNQIGRYSWHHHHLLGRRNNGLPYQFRFDHCSVDGSPKWGIAIHGSHFGLVNDCAIYNAAGSGIVTEDPWVAGNKITNNIVIAKQPGSNQRITTDHGGRSFRNFQVNVTQDHWHSRGGFGLTSAMNEISGNRTYCCKESFAMAGFIHASLYIPRERGVGISKGWSDPNALTLGEHMGWAPGIPGRYPFLFPTGGNIAWSGWRGWETWNASSVPGMPEEFFPGMQIVHCFQPTDFEDQVETHLKGWRILGDFTKVKPAVGRTGHSVAAFWKQNYHFGITCDDCEFRGYDVAHEMTNATEETIFNRCVFECPVLHYFPIGRVSPAPWRGEWNGCTFLPVGGKLVMIGGNWSQFSLAKALRVNNKNMLTLHSTSYHVRPWVDGRDIDLFHPEQHPTFAGPAITADQFYADWPKGVYSQQKLIELGTPIFGAAVPDTAFQADAFGVFWANDVTPPPATCDEKLRAAEAQNLELLRELEIERNN